MHLFPVLYSFNKLFFQYNSSCVVQMSDTSFYILPTPYDCHGIELHFTDVEWVFKFILYITDHFKCL